MLLWFTKVLGFVLVAIGRHFVDDNEWSFTFCWFSATQTAWVGALLANRSTKHLSWLRYRIDPGVIRHPVFIAYFICGRAWLIMVRQTWRKREHYCSWLGKNKEWNKKQKGFSGTRWRCQQETSQGNERWQISVTPGGLATDQLGLHSELERERVEDAVHQRLSIWFSWATGSHPSFSMLLFRCLM